MKDPNRISAFLRDRGRNFCIPEREDLFLRQIKVLDRDYNLTKKWDSFNSALDTEFNGNLDKFNRVRENFSTGLIEYYTEHKVNQQAEELIAKNGFKSSVASEGEILPGHSYLKINLVHAYNQVLDYYRFVSDTEEQLTAKFAEGSMLIASEKFPRLLSFTLFNKKAFRILSDQLLNLATSNLDHPLFKQLGIMGLPKVREGDDKLIYDITGFEDTFCSFEGPQVSNEVKFKVSIFRQESMIFYHDYALHIAPIKIDYSSGKKDFGDPRFRKYMVQLACIDQGWPISEKDLWWQDSDGLYRHSKPVRQVLLGPENVVD